MSHHPITNIIIRIFLLITTFLFAGIYLDPEFSSEVQTFTKYRPTFQFEFKDYSYWDRVRTPEMEREMSRYREFNIEHRY